MGLHHFGIRAPVQGFFKTAWVERTKGKEPLEGLGGPMARATTKKAKEAL